MAYDFEFDRIYVNTPKFNVNIENTLKFNGIVDFKKKIKLKLLGEARTFPQQPKQK